MTDKPKTKREVLNEYLSRPEVPEEVRQAWSELDLLVSGLTQDVGVLTLMVRSIGR